jgi:predicted  nucleic acid-binding Zn-ribbon protein
MADPFSVAGSAVGVTSLGIQTCQVLFRYYSQFKGLHDDIDDVLRRVEGLQGILDSLKVLKGRFEADNHEPSSQLHLALKTCEEVLHRLKQLADKCDATIASETFHDRLRYAKKRAIWPFKKETVEELQATLNGFQHNLSLALQSAGLDAVVQRIEELWPALDTLRDKTIGIEHHLLDHTSTLQNMGSDITSGFIRQEHNSMAVVRELLDLRNEVSRHTTVVQQGLNTLV